jgi:hypothetical protein
LGGGGRFIINDNLAGSPAGFTTTGTTRTEFAGSTSSNPFVSGVPATPNIPGLVGGAEAFGLATFSSGEIDALIASLPAIDVNGVPIEYSFGAVMRLDTGPGAYDFDFSGFDVLLYLNLTETPIFSPAMGAGAEAFSTSLSQLGWLNDPAYGGEGPQHLTTLQGKQAFMTLIPVNSLWFTLFGDGLTTSTQSLANGQALFLATTAVPEASAWLLVGVVAACVTMAHVRKRYQRS